MKNPKILIVDDQQTNIDLLKSHFPDYELDEANSGRMALKKIVAEKPDLILLDVMMPGIDGYTVLSIIKNSPETKNIPVICITSVGGPDDKAKSLEKGAEDFIFKPFKPVELQDKVRTLLKIKALRDELTQVQQLLIILTKTVEDKTQYFVGHSQRIANYAVRLARKELLPPVIQEEIKLAAQFHDIGMIDVPESIILKPDKLTEAELEKVRNHPIVGEKICSVLTTLKPILSSLRHHHERFDGTGYPDGLRGREIPLGARIIAVADSYDALTSSRPYREAYTPEEAMRILRENAATQWDPELVELFCQMVETGTLFD